jgi:light-regulated signal transduction histidine kinase (bacteriophytochrome)
MNDIVTAANVDLGNCDRETIHAPGLIQPHGAMLVLRAADLAILHASENTATLFGVPAPDSIRAGLAGLLGTAQADAVAAAIIGAGDRLASGPLHIGHFSSDRTGRAFDAIAHRAGDVPILELETIAPSAAGTPNLLPDVAACIAMLRSATSLTDFLALAAAQIRLFSGFDRVMAYRFAEDGSGEVLAEAKRDDLNAYLGTHFPATDIPAPARRLFALSWLRHLPNVDYVPVRLHPTADPPVDMSRAILRHVSVMYSSYLKNMGVHATMVMPLMKAGRLWGLVSCMHHSSPMHVPSDTRTATELIANVVSSLLAEQEDRDTASYRHRMSEAIAGLDRQMAREAAWRRGLVGGEVDLLGWLDAPGAALVADDEVFLFGRTPTETEVRGIVGWLSGRDAAASAFATDRLPSLYPPAETFKATGSGLLAARLIPGKPDIVMWFRPELLHTVAWAGDPRKPVQVDVVDGQARLTPRVSFDLWKMSVRGRSAPWLPFEIDAASALRQAIAEAILLRLNADLQRSNTELESFAFVASHDLKEPLRGIHNFATFLQRSAAQKLDDEERGRIATILRLTQRMEDLTDVLLQYSRVGRTDLSIESIDLNSLLADTLAPLEPRIAESGAAIRVPRPLPAIRSDRAHLAEVFGNLIINALKYSDRPAGERRIEIGWRDTSGARAFYVRDNGIGIAAQNLEKVFRIFRRLHARDEYGGGSGAGLVIARRIVERLGGRLWAESAGQGTGTTFLFTLGEVPAEAMAR